MATSAQLLANRSNRYAASAERTFYKAYRELTRQNEANVKELAAHQAPAQNEPNHPQPIRRPFAGLTIDNRQLTPDNRQLTTDN